MEARVSENRIQLLDHKRPLDKEGKQQCILLGSVLSSLKLQFDYVISSP